MIVIGLTGSIGMGKSTVAGQFAAHGAKVVSADACVHQLLAKDGAAVPLVQKYFPTAVKNGAVDRVVLGQLVFGDTEKRRQLESILHPLVIEMEEGFVYEQQALGAWAVVMDIPLLYETGGETRCDTVVVVSAPPLIQRQRVLARANMTPEKFARILASQMPDREKRLRADFLVETGLGKAHSFMQVSTICAALRGKNET
jgi:dephospho-CoA kinase